jgi:hypothetical protein
MQRDRMLPNEDTTGHFIRCAMGMFLESLRLLAANAGFALRHSLLDGEHKGPLIPFAELMLEEGAAASAYPTKLWQIRQTSRLASNGVRIPPEVSNCLRQLVPGYGQQYFQIDEQRLIEAIIQENIRAISHDLNDRAYHDEIVRWFRYSDREAEAKADGLDYRCMNVPANELKLMRSLPQIMRWKLTRGAVSRLYRHQIGRVSHIGIIAGQFFDNAGAIDAGAFLMRFWLELTKHNLVIHPFGNLVTNSEAKARVREITGIEDIWLVFRIGYTSPPPGSARLPLSKVLLD